MYSPSCELPQALQANLMPYAVVRKKRAFWKLPASYFTSIETWAPRVAKSQRPIVVDYSLHRAFQEKQAYYTHRFQWKACNATTAAVTIKSLPKALIKTIYQITVGNGWQLEAITEEHAPGLNFIEPLYLKSLQIKKLGKYLSHLLLLTNVGLISLCSWRFIALGNLYHHTYALKQQLNGFPTSTEASLNFEYAPFSEAFSAALYERQTTFTFWSHLQAALSILPSLHIQSCQLGYENPPTDPVDSPSIKNHTIAQKLLTLEGQWEASDSPEAPIQHQLDRFDTLLERLRTLAVVDQVECTYFEFVSKTLIRFSLKVNLRGCTLLN